MSNYRKLPQNVLSWSNHKHIMVMRPLLWVHEVSLVHCVGALSRLSSLCMGALSQLNSLCVGTPSQFSPVMWVQSQFSSVCEYTESV